MLDTQKPIISLAMLYVFYGCFSGFGVGVTYNTVISTVSQWFTDKSGAAIGTMMMGFGCGSFFLGSCLPELISRCGLFNTYLILGVAIAVILIVGSFLLKTPAEEQIIIKQTAADVFNGTNDKSSSYVVRDSVFWVYMLWAVISSIAGMLVIGNAAAIALSAGAPAIVGMVVSVCNGLGRIVAGALFDKLGRIKTMSLNISMLIMAGLIHVLGAYSDMMLLIIIGLMFMSIQCGSNPIISSSFVREQYGSKYYPSNFAMVSFCAIPGSIIGPTIASIIVTKSGGNYIGTYFVLICCGIISVFVFLLLNKLIKKQMIK